MAPVCVCVSVLVALPLDLCAKASNEAAPAPCRDRCASAVMDAADQNIDLSR